MRLLTEGKLGLSFNGARNAISGELQIVVTQNKAEGEMAVAAVHIMPKDILQSVQGESVSKRRLPVVINMIVAAGRPLKMTFLRPAPGIEERVKREEAKHSKEQKAYEKRMRQAQHGPAAPPAAEKLSMADQVCYNCHKPGHWKVDCPRLNDYLKHVKPSEMHLSSPERAANEADRIRKEREAKVNEILSPNKKPRKKRRSPAAVKLSMAERSMEAARKKTERDEANGVGDATPPGDEWGAPPDFSGKGSSTLSKRKSKGLLQPPRGGTPSMMHGGFGKNSSLVKYEAPPPAFKRGPLKIPERGGTPSMMRGAAHQKSAKTSAKSPAKKRSSPRSSAKVEQQLDDNNQLLEDLESQLQSLPSPTWVGKPGDEAEMEPQPRAWEPSSPEPAGDRILEPLAQGDAPAGGMPIAPGRGEQVRSQSVPPPAAAEAANEVFETQIEAESLENVEAELFAKLEKLSG